MCTNRNIEVKMGFIIVGGFKRKNEKRNGGCPERNVPTTLVTEMLQKNTFFAHSDPAAKAAGTFEMRSQINQ